MSYISRTVIDERVRAFADRVRSKLFGFEPGRFWWIVKHTKKSKELYPNAITLCNQLGISDVDMGKYLNNSRWNGQIGTALYSDLLRQGKVKEILMITVTMGNPTNAANSSSPTDDGSKVVMTDEGRTTRTSKCPWMMLQDSICGTVTYDPDLGPRPMKKRKLQDISVNMSMQESMDNAYVSIDTLSSTRVIAAQEVQEMRFKDSFTGKDPDKEFPVLHKFNIPLDYNWMSALLRDIVKLSRYSDGNILRFQYYNQYSSTLIPIPESANQYRFDRNTKEKGSWLQKLLEALVPSSIPNGNDQALLWLTSFIGCNNLVGNAATEHAGSNE